MSEESNTGCVYLSQPSQPSQIQFFELHSGMLTHTIPYSGHIDGMTFLRNGRFLASNSKGREILIINYEAGTIISQFNTVESLLSPQLSQANERQTNWVYFLTDSPKLRLIRWDIESGEELVALDLTQVRDELEIQPVDFEELCYLVVKDEILIGVGGWLLKYSLQSKQLIWKFQIYPRTTYRFLEISSEAVIVESAKSFRIVRLSDGSVSKSIQRIGAKLLSFDAKGFIVMVPLRKTFPTKLLKLDSEGEEVAEFVLSATPTLPERCVFGKTSRSAIIIDETNTLAYYQLPLD